MQRSIKRQLLAAFTGATLLSATLVSAAAAEVPSNQVPDSLKAAIRADIEAQGQDYAGFCRDIQQHEHIGEYCAFVLNLTENTAEVTYGPVLSEPTAHVTFLKVNGQWTHPGGGPGEGESGVPQGFEDAIEDFIEGRGHGYAGLCDEIAQDGSNIGKYCATVEDLDGDSATVYYGPVASGDISVVQFAKSGDTWSAPRVDAPYWVNDLDYGSKGGGFYWDNVSNRVWTAERGWHVYDISKGSDPLWVNHLGYGSKGGGFYLDAVASQVWTAERGWHSFKLA
jgi:hypothetical protein